METIQIEVSSELARRLRPFQNELVGILEQVLRQVEQERKPRTRAKLPAKEAVLRQRFSAALQQAGAYGADPETVSRYLNSYENRKWMPIRADGKPASEMIIEERASRPWFSW